MKYKCIIVDDEPLAREVIRTHALKTGVLNIVGECSNAMEAFQILKEESVDLIFLDIQMPGLRGIDLLRNLNNPPKVILSTAYRDYAFEAYELNVVDYLLKPVSFDRFIKAIDKFISTSPHTPYEKKGKSFIYLNINKKVYKIHLNDIVFVESIKDYITIHTTSGEIIAKHTLSAFESLLPQDDFVRIHRSYIVAINKIRSFNSHSIEIGNKELPIGQNYQSRVFDKLKYPDYKT